MTPAKKKPPFPLREAAVWSLVVYSPFPHHTARRTARAGGESCRECASWGSGECYTVLNFCLCAAARAGGRAAPRRAGIGTAAAGPGEERPGLAIPSDARAAARGRRQRSSAPLESMSAQPSPLSWAPPPLARAGRNHYESLGETARRAPRDQYKNACRNNNSTKNLVYLVYSRVYMVNMVYFCGTVGGIFERFLRFLPFFEDIK